MISELARAGRFVRSHIQIVSAFLVLFGVIATSYFGYRSLPADPPHLVVRQLGEISPIHIFEQLPIRITWDASPTPFGSRPIDIDDVLVAWIEIKNIGGEPFDFVERDLADGLQFEHSGSGHILDVQRRPSAPSTIEVHPEWKSFAVSAPYLNAGERIRFDVVHSGESDSIQLTARAKGLELITLEKGEMPSWYQTIATIKLKRASRMILINAVFLFGLCFVILLVVAEKIALKLFVVSGIAAILGSAIGFLLMLIPIFLSHQRWWDTATQTLFALCAAGAVLLVSQFNLIPRITGLTSKKKK